MKDRVVQTAVSLLLLPILEADSHPHSYAYRPQRNAHQAMDAIKEGLLTGRVEVIDADLSGYFDSIEPVPAEQSNVVAGQGCLEAGAKSGRFRVPCRNRVVMSVAS